jgi:hypothetical protein
MWEKGGLKEVGEDEIFIREFCEVCRTLLRE